MWVLWGNGIGCTAAGRMAKKSRVAWPNVAWAGVNTDAGSAAGGAPHAAAVQNETKAKRRRLRANSFGRALSPEP